MNLIEKENKRLKKLVQDLKKENEYFKSDLFLFEITETIQARYSVLLNPPPKDFSTTKNQKSCSFQIDMNDIVCIKAQGKIKWIFFNKKQKSVSGELFLSDKLHFTGTLESFCDDYDAPGIHLCIVSRSIAVNPNFYSIDSKKLRLSGHINPHNVCDNLLISSKYVSSFIEKKATLDKINSFQKISFRSK